MVTGWTELRTLQLSSWSQNGPEKPTESLDITGSADDRFSFWVDTRETGGKKAVKGAFLTVAKKEAFTLLKILIYPKTLSYASIAEIQEALLRNVRPPQLGLVERAKFHTLGLKD